MCDGMIEEPSEWTDEPLPLRAPSVDELEIPARMFIKEFGYARFRALLNEHFATVTTRWLQDPPERLEAMLRLLAAIGAPKAPLIGLAELAAPAGLAESTMRQYVSAGLYGAPQPVQKAHNGAEAKFKREDAERFWHAHAARQGYRFSWLDFDLSIPV